MIEFLIEHGADVLLGVAVVLLTLGKAFGSKVGVLWARLEKRSLQGELATIPEDLTEETALKLQEKHAASKVRAGESLGIDELEEVARRNPLAPSTISLLVTQLSRYEPGNATFEDLLKILCQGARSIRGA